MANWLDDVAGKLISLMSHDPQLALEIRKTVFLIEKDSKLGEWAGSNRRYFTDPELRFRVSYEFDGNQVLIVELNIF